MLIIDYSKIELKSDNNIKQLEGWMSIVSGEQKYPAFGKVALEFLYVVLKGSNYSRLGPYNEKTKKIGSITNPQIERALKVNTSILFSGPGPIKTTSRHLSSGAHY